MSRRDTKAIFLDRDGTINVDRGYVYRVEDWKLADDKVILALQQFQAAGYKLIVVTNQSGIGQGYYTVGDMQVLHRHMARQLLKAGIKIDLIMFCPHARDSQCQCRKPATGMLEEASRKMKGIDMAVSWTIGDKLQDIEMGQRGGTSTVLLKSKYWAEADLINRDLQPVIIVDTLYEAAQGIVGNEVNK